ncbi:MAG: sugar phosphate isomerase/epimerase [Chloroflexi bacterium]|nr:sugar phosphate isomerase/epimerase [Chloroflexota bacterium]
MRYTLNTLGAPGWSLEVTAREAARYGYEGVDLRLLDGEVVSLDLVRSQRQRLRRLFPRNRLPITVLGTSVRLVVADPTLQEQVDRELAEWVELAADLEIPIVRVFGGALPEGVDLDRAETLARERLAQVSEHAARHGVVVGLETHDDFSSAAPVARILASVPGGGVGAVWDMFHTHRMGEHPFQVLSLLGDRLVNVHLKDARRTSDGWQLVLLGEGEVPIPDALRGLLEHGYVGAISVEWEKRWHPELAEPEIAYPQHLALLRSYERELSLTP